jgi:hypothetical protein
MMILSLGMDSIFYVLLLKFERKYKDILTIIVKNLVIYEHSSVIRNIALLGRNNFYLGEKCQYKVKINNNII